VSHGSSRALLVCQDGDGGAKRVVLQQPMRHSAGCEQDALAGDVDDDSDDDDDAGVWRLTFIAIAQWSSLLPMSTLSLLGTAVVLLLPPLSHVYCWRWH
jgi:hypothetical protein